MPLQIVSWDNQTIIAKLPPGVNPGFTYDLLVAIGTSPAQRTHSRVDLQRAARADGRDGPNGCDRCRRSDGSLG